jgi:Lrp/AsnC family leucine-responsive transcriptional regulator
MDTIDRKIIGALQDDGRMSTTELAAHVSLSVSATSERLRRLRESGLIERFTIVVDQSRAGRPIQAIIDVRLEPNVDYDDVDAAIAELDAVVNAVHVTGRYEYQLSVAARDVAELDQLLTTLKTDLGAQETNTMLVLRTLDGFPRSIRMD